MAREYLLSNAMMEIQSTAMDVAIIVTSKHIGNDQEALVRINFNNLATSADA
jgi:hypothetical protein